MVVTSSRLFSGVAHGISHFAEFQPRNGPNPRTEAPGVWYGETKSVENPPVRMLYVVCLSFNSCYKNLPVYVYMPIKTGC